MTDAHSSVDSMMGSLDAISNFDDLDCMQNTYDALTNYNTFDLSSMDVNQLDLMSSAFSFIPLSIYPNPIPPHQEQTPREKNP
jgi:hypothetical protein